MPKISIVVPLYNKADYINDTLLSIFNQTYSDFECIIIDDGSTDESVQVIKNSKFIRDGRFKLVQQANAGQVEARNHGIRLSKGNYITLIDADNIIDVRKLEKQSKYLDRHPKIDVVMSQYAIFHTENALDGYRVVWHFRSKSMCRNWGNFKGFGGDIESSGMFRASFLKRVSGFDPRFSTSSGLDIAVQAMLVGKLKLINRVHHYYRLSSNQWHHDFVTLESDALKIYQKHGGFFSQKDSERLSSYLKLNSIRNNKLQIIDYTFKAILRMNYVDLEILFSIILRNIRATLLGRLFVRQIRSGIQRAISKTGK